MTDYNKNKIGGEDGVKSSNYSNDLRRPVSKDERVRIKFGHQVYSKAAILFESLKDSQNTTNYTSLEFHNEFEKRRAFSLAFAAKRYESILKDVLLDSSFYSSYFKLETFHHSKVMVMLLDFYEHDFRFSESTRKKMEEINIKDRLDHIQDIQKAFFQHKIKLCSAFARNRIKACALTLDAMLSKDVKEQKESGSRHPLFAWVNPMVTQTSEVLKKLKEDHFILKDDLVDNEENEMEKIFSLDTKFNDLLAFPSASKDDIYNSQLALSFFLVPMSKPRYMTAEIVKRIYFDLCRAQEKSNDLINTATGPGGNNTRNTITTEGCDIILTHPETGSLSVHICSFLSNNRRLIMFGCQGNKNAEIEYHLKNIGVKDFVLINDKFTYISPADDRFSSVKIIICNPPCSKSGVVNVVDYIIQEGADSAVALSKKPTAVKIRGYVEEQANTLKTAFSFTTVQTIVYSTFSVHAEENESLVDRLVNAQPNTKNCFDSVSIWDDLKIPQITEQDKKYLKVSPSNEMDGFFVSLLQRRIREDSVHEVIERAAKKGLVKKSRATSSKPAKKKIIPKQQPPHVERRLSRSVDPEEARKMLNKTNGNDDRFKF